MNYLFIMLGGALGAASRYGIAQLLSGNKLLSMPVGTITVNLIGCFILGVLTALSQRNVCLPGLCAEQSRQLFLLLTVGFCGAFTTFSTFSGEAIKAMEAGMIWQPAAYVIISVGVGMLLFWCGKSIA